MITAIVLFTVGLLLSAFFSGSETGMYRVSRTRLVLDGLSGSAAARGLVWLLNHPAIFVATTLVGNNIANYFTSFAVVSVMAIWFGSGSSAELIGPMLITPVVFVLGELLPKYLFFHAPYRLITATRPILLAATVIFAPVAVILGLLGRGLQRVTGQTPFRLRLVMARGDLDQILRHGHEAGILAAGQRSLAQRLFEVGNQSAISYGVPADRLARVDAPIDLEQARNQARRRNHPIVLVRRGQRIIGFVWYADLCVRQPNSVQIRPVIQGRFSDRHLQILLRLYDAGSEVAVLMDDRGGISGVVTRRQLVQPLMK
ncbi:MAG: CNNM domain-containing protein [Planctomycetota bacterium]